MIFEQIRNATVSICYGDKKFLVDPWLMPKGALGSFNDLQMGLFSPYPEKNSIPMPMVELPKTISEILADIDAYIVTHIHPDHIDMMPDGTVGTTLDKNVSVIIRDAEETPVYQNSGFKKICPLSDECLTFGNVTLTRTPALHGTEQLCGPACGLIFQAEGEPTIYLMGDTVLHEDIAEIIQTYNPKIIIMNSCAAELVGFGKLITGKEDIKKVREIAPNATILISHMDTVSHQTVTRTEMKEYLLNNNLSDNVLIPDDGKTYIF